MYSPCSCLTGDARAADVDEAAIGDRTSDPSALVLELGLAKAEALLPALKAELEQGTLGATYLLTADQGITLWTTCLPVRSSSSSVRKVDSDV